MWIACIKPRMTKGRRSAEDDDESVTSQEGDDREMVVAEALWDHISLTKSHLPFKRGELLQILEQNGDMWRGRNDAGVTGWFPPDSVRVSYFLEFSVLIGKSVGVCSGELLVYKGLFFYFLEFSVLVGKLTLGPVSSVWRRRPHLTSALSRIKWDMAPSYSVSWVSLLYLNIS
eukprot:sb/3472103/